MASIEVEKVYYVPHRDLVVLAGRFLGRIPEPGWCIDIPRALKGPGWVVIADVQQVPFADRERSCIILQYTAFESAPLMEFADLEGAVLDYRP